MNRRSLLTSALFALAARRLPFPAWAEYRGGGGADRQTRVAARRIAVRRPEISVRLQAIRLRQRQGAQRRRGAADRARHLRQFQRGRAGVKGALAVGVDLIYDTLLVPALDEVSSEYGLLAEAVSYPEDFSSVSYRLRAEAKWHDGKPITPEDVIFSFDAFKKHSPQFAANYRHVVKVEKTGDREVTFTFDGPGNRELPQIVGQLTVLPKDWWEGTDKDGKKRDIGATTLEPPLGSGALPHQGVHARPQHRLRAGQGLLGQAISTSTSAATISMSCGSNISAMRTVALEAFKGDTVDWRIENSAKNWATAYDFPAVTDKRVILEEFPDQQYRHDAGFRLQHPPRQIPGPARAARLQLRVRFRGDEQADLLRPVQAHRQLFRRHRTCLRRGLPQGRELEMLETVRDKVPPEVFTKPYANPVGGNPAAVRDNLREAVRLFKEAGYEMRDQQARQRQDRRAVHGGISRRRSELRARLPVLQAVARTARHHRDGAHGRRGAIREPAAQLGFRHHHLRLARVAVAGQRAARATGARRPPISPARTTSSASKIRRSMR